MSQWRCSWQDYRNWRSSDIVEERPGIYFRDFDTQEEARAAASPLRVAGMVVSVGPTPPPKRRRTAKKQDVLRVNGERFNKHWRLTE